MNEEMNQASKAPEAPETSEAPIESEAPEASEGEPSSSPPRRRSVFAYLAILFGTAFLLLLFAYLMQQRDSQEIMGNLSQLRESMGSIQSIDQLVEENRTLREERDGLQARLDELEKQVGELEEKLAVEEKSRECAVAEWESAYNKYVGYTSILEALYDAEVKLADKDYKGAAERLTGIQYQYFLDTMALYDAEIENYSRGDPNALYLRPRFDALVEELTEQGTLDESWAEPAEGEKAG